MDPEVPARIVPVEAEPGQAPAQHVLRAALGASGAGVTTVQSLRSILDGTAIGIVVVDSAGKIQLANAVALAWFQYDEVELIGAPLEILMPGRLRAGHAALRQRYQADPVARPMGTTNPLLGRRKDGSELTLEVALHPVTTDAGPLIVAALEDVNQRIGALMGRSDRDARFQAAFDAAPRAVAIVSPDHRFLEVNHRLCALVDRHRSRLIGMTVDEIIHPEDREAVASICTPQAQSCRLDVRCLRPDGSVIRAELTWWLMADESCGFLGLDEAPACGGQAASVPAGPGGAGSEITHVSLGASLSHELRAPLRAIHGFAEILMDELRGQLSPQASVILTTIRQSAHRMGRMLEALVDLDKISRTNIERRDVDLSLLASAAVHDLRRIESDRHVEVIIAPDLVAAGDSTLLRILYDNLIGNAWKFTRGVPAARIEIGARPRGDETVFFVSDNGAGFPVELATKMFNPFRRLHTEDEFPGAGVGLATVQRIIQEHRGEVWSEGEVGEGATIFFTLPR